MIGKFRLALAGLRSKTARENLAAANSELDDYRGKNYPIIYAINEKSELVGYLVYCVEGDVLWVEALFVDTGYRRHGIGSNLCWEAERAAKKYTENPPYYRVDPNNRRLINFLKKRGYNALNLAGLGQPRPDEVLTNQASLGMQEFDCL
jgi:GNAT superfamily N-acetyltransferase